LAVYVCYWCEKDFHARWVGFILGKDRGYADLVLEVWKVRALFCISLTLVVQKLLGLKWKYQSVVGVLKFWMCGVTTGRGTIFRGSVRLYRWRGRGVHVADNVVFSSDPQANPLSRGGHVALAVLSDDAFISIGRDTGLSSCSIVAAIGVEIGREVLIGAGATIMDTDFHVVHSAERRYNRAGKLPGCAPIRIGDNVWIGAEAKVLKGVVIGDHSVVAAGSVVVESVPPMSIVAGVPARLIGRVKVE
jgi:acetyltransferase-like isoleucine patch superfamily enzyme